MSAKSGVLKPPTDIGERENLGRGDPRPGSLTPSLSFFYFNGLGRLNNYNPSRYALFPVLPTSSVSSASFRAVHADDNGLVV